MGPRLNTCLLPSGRGPGRKAENVEVDAAPSVGGGQKLGGSLKECLAGVNEGHRSEAYRVRKILGCPRALWIALEHLLGVSS